MDLISGRSHGRKGIIASAKAKLRPPKGQSETECHEIPSRFPHSSPINPEFLSMSRWTHRTQALRDVFHLHCTALSSSLVIFTLFIYFPGQTDCVSLCESRARAEVLQIGRERGRMYVREFCVVKYEVGLINMYCHAKIPQMFNSVCAKSRLTPTKGLSLLYMRTCISASFLCRDFRRSFKMTAVRYAMPCHLYASLCKTRWA